MADAIEQENGGFEAAALAPEAAGRLQDASESYGQRGIEVGAAGGEEIAAGVGECFLEEGQFAPVADGARR